MHENEISEEIIGAAIEVHRMHSPGLLESVYEELLRDGIHRVVNNLREQV